MYPVEDDPPPPPPIILLLPLLLLPQIFPLGVGFVDADPDVPKHPTGFKTGQVNALFAVGFI